MTQPQPSKKYDAGQELKYCSILLRRVAVSVILMIREFLNSITSIPQKKPAPSADSLPPATAGPPKSSVQKSGNAEYYVRTATGNTPSSSKITTPIPRLPLHCEKSIKPTELGPEDCKRIREGLISGELDLRTISMATWLHVSYLELYNQKESHATRTMVHNGNVYTLHFCVTSVVPPAEPEKLKEKQ